MKLAIVLAMLCSIAVNAQESEEQTTIRPDCSNGDCSDQQTETSLPETTTTIPLYNPYEYISQYNPYYQYNQLYQYQRPQETKPAQYEQAPEEGQEQEIVVADPYQQFLQYLQFEQYQHYLQFLQYQQQYPELMQQLYPELNNYFPVQSPTTEANVE